MRVIGHGKLPSLFPRRSIAGYPTFGSGFSRWCILHLGALSALIATALTHSFLRLRSHNFTQRLLYPLLLSIMQTMVLVHRRQLFSTTFTYVLIALFAFMHLQCAEAGQYFTSGLSIINSPSPNRCDLYSLLPTACKCLNFFSPGHAGSTLPISIDVSKG